MLALDLCCGTGGWSDGLAAAGFEVIGIDIAHHPAYAHPFVCADVRTIQPGEFPTVSLVVASPPCEAFSRHGMPWLRAKNPPKPDTSIWLACVALGKALGCPTIIENVKSAQLFMGQANAIYGSRYLWGDVPALLPPVQDVRKERLSSNRYFVRAHVPFVLARYIGDVYMR